MNKDHQHLPATTPHKQPPMLKWLAEGCREFACQAIIGLAAMGGLWLLSGLDPAGDHIAWIAIPLSVVMLCPQVLLALIEMVVAGNAQKTDPRERRDEVR